MDDNEITTDRRQQGLLPSSPNVQKMLAIVENKSRLLGRLRMDIDKELEDVTTYFISKMETKPFDLLWENTAIIDETKRLKKRILTRL